MENKVVCHYCGTVYDAEKEKCPLCGSVVRSDNVAPPPQRKRLSEKERKQRRRRGKFAAVKAKSPKGLQIAALVFLAVAVIAVGWFIGDMLDWWPGAEDNVQREQSAQAGTQCTLLRISKQELQFDAVGQTETLSLTTNSGCTQTTLGSFSVSDIASFTQSPNITVEGEEKSTAVVITALAEGETVLTFTCGEQSASCVIRCGTAAPVPTEPVDFTPVLNYGSDFSLFTRGETRQLLVTNLPEGTAVTWSSADATIAKVSEYGEVTAIGNGQTTIKATAAGKSVEVRVRCVFNLEDIGAHLESGRSDVTVNVGDTFELYLYDAQGEHITDITYSVANPSICRVTDGQVAALSSGTTTVTITYYNLTFACIVRVR